MKLTELYHKTNELISYLAARRKRRLYRQWVNTANLSLEAVPKEIVNTRIIQGREKVYKVPKPRLY